jgi:hypothetical protein
MHQQRETGYDPVPKKILQNRLTAARIHWYLKFYFEKKV